jgi:hypothetical protein
MPQPDRFQVDVEKPESIPLDGNVGILPVIEQAVAIEFPGGNDGIPGKCKYGINVPFGFFVIGRICMIGHTNDSGDRIYEGIRILVHDHEFLKANDIRSAGSKVLDDVVPDIVIHQVDIVIGEVLNIVTGDL